MKPTPIFVAAAGFAMIGACSVTTDENTTAENVDSNAASATTTSGESVLPVTDNDAGADTLGNQLNQLNASDAAAANQASNETANETNSQ
jgi:hypothetical protein